MDFDKQFAATYVPIEPLTQWKGTDPETQKISYYKVDPNGFLVEKYDDTSGKWISYLDHGWFQMPVDMTEAIGAFEKEQLAEQMATSGLFKAKSNYLQIGDEPNGNVASGVFDLKGILSKEDFESLKQFLTLMPRSILYEWFKKKIWPDIPWDLYKSDGPTISTAGGYVYGTAGEMYGDAHPKKQFEDLIWGAFIDVFNEANLTYVTENNLAPWDWEAKKLEAYTLSKNQDALDSLESQFSEYEAVSLALDPKAKEIMEQYIKLPKVGDPGLEINRQNAVKQLLKMKAYAEAQAIVDAFRYASETVIGEAITQPIPFDIVSADNGPVVKKTVL